MIILLSVTTKSGRIHTIQNKHQLNRNDDKTVGNKYLLTRTPSAVSCRLNIAKLDSPHWIFLRLIIMKRLLLLPLGLLFSLSTIAAEGFWPNGAKAAVSLAYDDALNSHLDNAIPHLDKYNFKASFYLTMASPVVSARLNEWRDIASNGHELGNHTLNHGCSKTLLGNPSWLQDWNDLDKRTINEMQVEVQTADAFLTAIDGKTERTFTAPCGHWQVSDGSYQNVIKPQFIALKAVFSVEPQDLKDIDPKNVHVAAAPAGVSGKTLITFVKQAAAKGSIANITFHGIGGDHLAITNQAHQELLAYLHANKKDYWVDTFANIMTHFNKQKGQQ